MSAACCACNYCRAAEQTRDLSSYQVIGIENRTTTNGGFLFDSRYFTVIVRFKNEQGNLAYAKCRFYLKTGGLSFAVTKNYYRMTLLGSKLTLKDFMNRKIQIGSGGMFELAVGGGHGVHIAKIQEPNGGFLVCRAWLLGGSFQAGYISGGYFKLIGQPVFLDINTQDAADELSIEETCTDTNTAANKPATITAPTTVTSISYATTEKR